MALPQEQDRVYTLDDIYELPEGTRAELIDGQIYYMAPPSASHQILSGELHTKINNYIKDKEGSCKVVAAPFAVFIKPHDDRFYIEPDISVICDPNKINNKGCKGAPDWVIEITSPSNAPRDYIDKLHLYKKYGVREYWIVNQKKKTVMVYYFENDSSPDVYDFSSKVKVNIYDDFYIDFKELTNY